MLLLYCIFSWCPVYLSVLGFNLTPAHCMLQVLSRCFGQEPDLAMLPFTDLCNHSLHAMAPNRWATPQHCLWS